MPVNTSNKTCTQWSTMPETALMNNFTNNNTWFKICKPSLLLPPLVPLTQKTSLIQLMDLVMLLNTGVPLLVTKYLMLSMFNKRLMNFNLEDKNSKNTLPPLVLKPLKDLTSVSGKLILLSKPSNPLLLNLNLDPKMS